MNTVHCDNEDCKYNEDRYCERDHVWIEQVYTASGFHPICTEYEEEEDNGIETRKVMIQGGKIV